MNPVELAAKDLYSAVEIGKLIRDSQPPTSYPFLPAAEFKVLLEENVPRAMRVYWFEILLRSHMCAVSGLKRFLDWVEALERSEGNYILFCSSLRGLMECAGDTFDGLSHMAFNLAENHGKVRMALAGKMTDVITAQKWEDQLVHFSHASGKRARELAQAEIKPKRPREYVESLEKGSSLKFYEYYQAICEIVHPASDSLGYNFDEHNGLLRWNGKRDAEIISLSIERQRDLITELLMRGLNPIFVLMKTVNVFGVNELHIPLADRLDLKALPGWARISSALKT
jgi:hypothetical protein